MTKVRSYRRNLFLVGCGAGICALVSILLAIPGFGRPFDVKDCLKVTQALILSAWIIVPPVWFFYEFYRYEPTPERPFETFKYGQELCSKIWLALVTMLLGLYFGKDLLK